MTEAGAGSPPARAPRSLGLPARSGSPLARSTTYSRRSADFSPLHRADSPQHPTLRLRASSFKAERGFLTAPPRLASVHRSIKAARRYETVDAPLFEHGLERAIRRSATSCIQDACKIDWAGARPHDLRPRTPTTAGHTPTPPAHRPTGPPAAAHRAAHA